MNYTAIIVEDEVKLREVLAVKLEKNCPGLRIIDKVGDAKQAYASIAYYKPDIVFLDIMMPEENGFDLLKRFDNIDFEIIFITGYQEYALDALKMHAADYLLKPVKNEDLIQAIERAEKRIRMKENAIRYEVLQKTKEKEQDPDAKITISGNSAYEFVKVADIIRCEGWQKYTKVYLTNGDVITSSYNIGVFKTSLEPYGFYSCHRSHIVNRKRISKYLKEGTIIMLDGSEIPVAKRKRDEFHHLFIKYGQI